MSETKLRKDVWSLRLEFWCIWTPAKLCRATTSFTRSLLKPLPLPRQGCYKCPQSSALLVSVCIVKRGWLLSLWLYWGSEESGLRRLGRFQSRRFENWALADLGGGYSGARWGRLYVEFLVVLGFRFPLSKYPWLLREEYTQNEMSRITAKYLICS